MQPNNNPITEIGVILVSLAFIAAGTVVFVLGKVDLTGMTSILLLAAGVFGGNLVLKAPSPTQQAALLQLAAQAPSQQAQPVQPAPTPAPAPTSLPATPVVQLPFPAMAPGAVTMTPAIRTTLNVPAVQP